MAVTPNYNLSVYSATDTSVKFLDFRTSIAGTSQSSNFYVIDTVLKQFADSITVLQNDPSAYQVNALYVSANFYAATVTGMTSYKKGQLIILSLDTTNVGTVTVNINNIGTVSVMKYTSTGTIVNMEDGDIRKNSQVLCMYDGTRFVTIGFTTADQINVIGTVGDVLTISANNTIQDSGKKIGAANGIATLDGSGNVVEKANQLVNTLTVQGNDVNIGTFDGSTAQTINITPANIGAATTAQGTKADALVAGTVAAGNASKLNGQIGLYYLYNPNILDNTNFLLPVNQKNITTATGGGYVTIDRWTHGVSSVSTQVTANGLRIFGGDSIYGAPLIQKLPTYYSTTEQYCFTICDSYDNQYSVTGAPNNANYPTPFGSITIRTYGDNVSVQITVSYGKEVTLKWAKLELGNLSTPYVIKKFGEELAECQRYFLALGSKVGGTANIAIGVGNAFSSTNAAILVPLPATLRTTPTVTLPDSSAFLLNLANNSTSINLDVTSISIQSMADNAINLLVTASGLTTSFVRLQTKTAGSRIFLSADL